MAARSVQCPECSTSLKINPKGSGSVKCKCPKCDTRFEVPGADSQERPVLRRQSMQRSDESQGSSSALGWLIAGGALFVVVGVLAVGCIVVGLPAGGDANADKDKKIVQANTDAKKENPDADREIPKKDDDRPVIKDEPKDKAPDRDGIKTPDPVPKKKPQYRGGSLIIPFDAIATQERLREVKTVQIKGSIKFKVANNTNDVVITWESMRRLKYAETIGTTGRNLDVVLVGGHGWMLSGDKTITLQGDGLGFYQNFNYATILSNLILLTEEGFEVEKAGTSTIRGKECFGLIVKRAGRPNLKMYFERDTNLLYKADFQGRFVDQNLNFMAETTNVEFFFSDYEIIDGIKHWRTQEQWRDGREYSVTKLSEVRFLAKPDDSLFSAPGLEKEIERALEDDKAGAIKRMLTRLGPAAGSDFTRLVKGLYAGDAETRAAVRKALGTFIELRRTSQIAALNRDDVDALTILLKADSDVPLQSFALDTVTQLGPQAEGAVSTLLAIARGSSDSRLLANVLNALKRIGAKSPDAVAVYEQRLDHADPEVKDGAALALILVGPDRLPITRLTELMARPNTEIRANADRLLRQKLASVTRKDLPELRAGLKNPVKEVRLAFIDAIGSLKADGADAVRDLTSLLGSTDRQIADRSARALEAMGKLAAAVRETTDADILIPALTALRTNGVNTEEAVAIYAKNLNHSAGAVRNEAGLAMLNLAPDRLMIGRLTEMMAGDNPEIRAAAGKLLPTRLATVTVKDLPALRQGLKNPVREARVAFIRAVGLLKKEGAETAPELADLANGPDTEIAIQANRALEKMGKAASVAAPLLVKALDNPEKAIAVAATLALCKIDPDNQALKTKGIGLLVEDLSPNINELNVFLAKPLEGKAAALIQEIGAPAVAPVVKHLISRHNPRMQVNQQVGPTASRYLGYALLREYAKRAKANADTGLVTALKKYEVHIKIWETDEANLARQAKQAFGLTPDARLLYAKTADAAFHAKREISALRAP